MAAPGLGQEIELVSDDESNGEPHDGAESGLDDFEIDADGLSEADDDSDLGVGEGHAESPCSAGPAPGTHGVGLQSNAVAANENNSEDWLANDRYGCLAQNASAPAEPVAFVAPVAPATAAAPDDQMLD